MAARDYFSKLTEAYSLSKQSTSWVATALVENMFSPFRISFYCNPIREGPLSWKYSRSVKFLGLEIQGWHCYFLSPIALWSNSVRLCHSMYSSTEMSNTNGIISLIMIAYQSAVHYTIGWTGAIVMFGRKLHLPSSRLFGSPQKEETNVNNYTKELLQKLRTIHSEVWDKIRIESDHIRTWYDLRISRRTFYKGGKVWLYNQPNQHWPIYITLRRKALRYVLADL